MTYLYGDATPFPFRHNFIETLCAATDVCVALFRAELQVEDGRQKASALRANCERELKRLHQLGTSIEAAVQPLLPTSKSSAPSELTADRVRETAMNVIKQAQASVTARQSRAGDLIMSEQIGQDSFAAVARLLQAHSLPKTQWSLRWRGNHEGAEASSTMTVPFGLSATFTTPIAPDNQWARAVRVRDLSPKLVLRIPSQGKRDHKIRLNKLFMVDASLSKDEFLLRFADSARGGSGYRLVLGSDDHAFAVITPLNDKGEEAGAALTVPDSARKEVLSLGSRLETMLRKFRDERKIMQRASYRGGPVMETNEPARLAEAILGALAPTIRQMRLRSCVPGELILKRDLGDGRREELYVPRARILAKFAGLPLEQRRFFESIGLSGEPTQDFVTRSTEIAEGTPTDTIGAPPLPPIPNGKPSIFAA